MRIGWAALNAVVLLAVSLLVFPQGWAVAVDDTTPPTGTIVINGNRSATNAPNVTLALTWSDGAGTGVSRMRFSNDGSTWSSWETPVASRAYTLPAGPDGHRTVRVQYLDRAGNRSAVYADYIRLDTTLPTGTILINGGASVTPTHAVTLGLTWSDGAGAGVSRMRFSDNGSTWTPWMPPTATLEHTLPAGPDGHRTVRVQYLDGAGNYSAVFKDYIRLAADIRPVVTDFSINSGAATTMPLGVTLDNTATEGPTEYMASETSDFAGAVWQAYGTSPAFTLSFGVGTRTVYFKVRDAALVESNVVSDTIFLVPNMVPVAAGSFNMGRRAIGTNDDRRYGDTDEDPVHSVTLAAYSLGKYEVTNKEYCDVLNWALSQGYLYQDEFGTPWMGRDATENGPDSIYAGCASARYVIVDKIHADIKYKYTDGVFTSTMRVGWGGTNYSMDTHPMVFVSWYGAVAFCNWLSEMQGLTPCYDMTAANWPLVVAPPTAGGYRLPTEAEWERAAAWGETSPGSGVYKHWIYGFMSDTNSGPRTNNRCNDSWYDGNVYAYVNPFGLTETPYTSPVGWFNGVNMSPNWRILTVDSPSPVGAYDMSGNVSEWCGDWYQDNYYYYAGNPEINPTGPAATVGRVCRGGSWYSQFKSCRSAYRSGNTPAFTNSTVGFRLARS